MRVVGGRVGGRVLHAPRGRRTRPTPERVREAVFSILESVEDRHVLDLFAGSGALAIEALSRGASSATLVDCAPAAVGVIRRNLDELGLEAEVHQQRVSAFLQRASNHERQYDLVFLDPPYHLATSLGGKLSAALEPVLASGAVVVAESDRRAPLGLPTLELVDERRYGDTLIRIFRGPR